ncbi:putative lipoprotein [Kribbella flavida DSM 17836]|uniref:Putative lipoprotein n=1 Tax=Kribbella flavida (strain DSM 17836 / JCM 10339 / NBRC 14399) TaxID=479435 RepID=D2PYF2_KRIFD|nr:lipoprotein [Kribbella flavida]ADB35520.1 putative lipoprotein [Kribbella flavida DSM 17836]
MSDRRMRSVGITLGLTALVAASLTGCSSDDEDQPDYAAICVDPETEQRTSDENCKDEREYNGSGAGFFWFYMATRSGVLVPPIGGRYPAGSGTYTVPRTGTGGAAPSVRRGGLNPGGGDIGTITRGGFGKSGKGSSGG